MEKKSYNKKRFIYRQTSKHGTTVKYPLKSMFLHMYQVGITVHAVNTHVPSWYGCKTPVKSRVFHSCVIKVTLSIGKSATGGTT